MTKPYQALKYADLEHDLAVFITHKQRNIEPALFIESHPKFIRFAWYDHDDIDHGSVDAELIFTECNEDYCECHFKWHNHSKFTEKVNEKTFLAEFNKSIHFEMSKMAMKDPKEFLALLIDAIKDHLIKCIFCDVIEVNNGQN